VAIGHRPIRKFSWAITLLDGRQELQHVETGNLAIGGTQDPDLGSPCPTSATIPFCIIDARQMSRNIVFQMNVWTLSARIGLLNLVGDRWRFGIMFQTPGVKAGRKSKTKTGVHTFR
jgi:hypothetical protein